MSDNYWHNTQIEQIELNRKVWYHFAILAIDDELLITKILSNASARRDTTVPAAVVARRVISHKRFWQKRWYNHTLLECITTACCFYQLLSLTFNITIIIANFTNDMKLFYSPQFWDTMHTKPINLVTEF